LENYPSLDITDLKIFPFSKRSGGRFKILAVCIATFNNGIVIDGIKIKEGKNGIWVRLPTFVTFANPEAKKAACNRILASWVINHCIVRDRPHLA